MDGLNNITRIIIHFLSFAVAMMALGAIDFNRFLKQNRVWQSQLLYISLAMMLGFGIAQFLIQIMWN